MSYKTILVHADLSRHAPARIRAAAGLAKAHGAHLLGVAATGVSQYVFPRGYHALPGSLEASYFAPLHDKAQRALAQFGTIAAEVGVSAEPRLISDLASEALARTGRFADLVVVNQDDLAEALTETAGRIPEYVVLTSARPVLVLPCAPPPQRIGQYVLVAWNGSKEASAALRAAVPLLQRAVRVTVVSFATPDDAEQFTDSEQADLTAFLARHGVRAETLLIKRTIECGDTLLTLATQDGYDLIVMGCYGHTQFREMFLGGVSRTILQKCSLPVLMAR
ncbi:universal stress protein [Massilia sp. ST3]|uniref:universal stress protein n=1 Tax=Massilia sp. ST3 TaxID=2824903 RepID=UPI001B81D366|nr:universal stress protein [Massilia sp. ST3]MBQ5948483.1 universal stress protein [Massilia sp. ST3]